MIIRAKQRVQTTPFERQLWVQSEKRRAISCTSVKRRKVDLSCQHGLYCPANRSRRRRAPMCRARKTNLRPPSGLAHWGTHLSC